MSKFSRRVTTIDSIRGFVRALMIAGHASMAFDRFHVDHDSAMFSDAGTMALPAAGCFPRCLAHLCAPWFVFLMGDPLAISVERRVVKGVSGMEIDSFSGW